MTALFANPIVKKIMQVAVLYAYTHIVLDMIHGTVHMVRKLRRGTTTPQVES